MPSPKREGVNARTAEPEKGEFVEPEEAPPREFSKPARGPPFTTSCPPLTTTVSWNVPVLGR
jgi:hypothetical protein